MDNRIISYGMSSFVVRVAQRLLLLLPLHHLPVGGIVKAVFAI